jgi:hypothetical protein
MKLFILYLILCLSLIEVNAQEKRLVFFNEYFASVNRTMLSKGHSRIGFGFGTSHSFMRKEMVNLLTGIEYNHTGQFWESTYDSHFSHSTNVTYRMNMISIPLVFRINVNFIKESRIFFEAGLFRDLVFLTIRKGTHFSYIPDESNHVVYRTSSFREKTDLSSYMGLISGIGFIMPFKTHELFFKTDLKVNITNIESGYQNFSNKYLRFTIGYRLTH